MNDALDQVREVRAALDHRQAEATALRVSNPLTERTVRDVTVATLAALTPDDDPFGLAPVRAEHGRIVRDLDPASLGLSTCSYPDPATGRP